MSGRISGKKALLCIGLYSVYFARLQGRFSHVRVDNENYFCCRPEEMENSLQI